MQTCHVEIARETSCSFLRFILQNKVFLIISNDQYTSNTQGLHAHFSPPVENQGENIYSISKVPKCYSWLSRCGGTVPIPLWALIGAASASSAGRFDCARLILTYQNRTDHSTASSLLTNRKSIIER